MCVRVKVQRCDEYEYDGVSLYQSKNWRLFSLLQGELVRKCVKTAQDRWTWIETERSFHNNYDDVLLSISPLLCTCALYFLLRRHAMDGCYLSRDIKCECEWCKHHVFLFPVSYEEMLQFVKIWSLLRWLMGPLSLFLSIYSSWFDLSEERKRNAKFPWYLWMYECMLYVVLVVDGRVFVCAHLLPHHLEGLLGRVAH